MIGAGGRLACLAWGLLWLAGCAGPAPPEPEALVELVPSPARLAQPAPKVRAERERSLCDVLTGLLAAEADGFSRLRGQLIAHERWRAAESVPGVGRCTIEGDAQPRARFLCVGERLGSEQAHARFDRLAAEIDRCLARSSWFPRHWERGQRFEFAMGERQQAWADRSSAPPTAIVLKVHQDLTHWDYQVLLDLHALR